MSSPWRPKGKQVGRGAGSKQRRPGGHEDKAGAQSTRAVERSYSCPKQRMQGAGLGAGVSRRWTEATGAWPDAEVRLLRAEGRRRTVNAGRRSIKEAPQDVGLELVPEKKTTAADLARYRRRGRGKEERIRRRSRCGAAGWVSMDGRWRLRGLRSEQSDDARRRGSCSGPRAGAQRAHGDGAALG